MEATLLQEILNWSSNQSHILTGDNLLSIAAVEGEDFTAEDLPHYHLTNSTTRMTFKRWMKEYRVSYSIVGCWSRPLFSGGWRESTNHDTVAFNFQSPSYFIDMRFCIHRRGLLSGATSLQTCSDTDLRILGRQHCFAGYSLPESFSAIGTRDMPLFTRHHFIDWNYHPNFPRKRPNRWWVEVNADGSSFKEFSFVRDANGIPVYFERWERRNEDSSGQKYLVLRKNGGCPFDALKAGRSYPTEGLLIVMGNTFGYCRDRKVLLLPGFEDYDGPSGGGCAALVDFAIARNDREAARSMLDLQGCCGYVSTSQCQWKIDWSTHPWKENTPLFDENTSIIIEDCSDSFLVKIDGETWESCENTFSKAELQCMFSPCQAAMRSKL